MAALMVALLPVIVLFLLLQSRFVEGLTSGATKG
jgi:ABC-type glycerol-3-phosphate transport system permease component